MRLLAWALVLIFSMSSAEAKVTNKAKRASTEPTIDIGVVNNPATREIISRRAKGAAVLRAQILLDRAHFSVGEIDGSFGENMEHAVKSYQTAHGLQSDGVITPDLWRALNVDTGPAPLTTYTIAPQDTARALRADSRRDSGAVQTTLFGISIPLGGVGRALPLESETAYELEPGEGIR